MENEGKGLHARVLESLGPAITAGDYPPGTVLRTDELEQRFDVSRTVIREAIRVLESMQLVASRRRVGVTVRPTEEWNVYDPRVIGWRLAGRDRPRQLRSLTVLRSAIEPVAAGLAAQHATPRSAPNSPNRPWGWSPPHAASSSTPISSTTRPSTVWC